jgi:hypothetical protein
MDSRTVRFLVLMLVAALTVGAAGCKALHERVIDLVITNKACMDFVERHDTANYVGDVQTVEVADDIDDALASLEPPLEREDVQEARLTTASFEVTGFDDPGHDWVIGGTLMIAYGAVEDTMATYTEVSIADAYAAGEPIYFDGLTPEGVSLFNQALEDYLNGFRPEVSFWVVSDGVTPAPSPSDSLKFDWTGCLHMYVVSSYRTEVVDFFTKD